MRLRPTARLRLTLLFGALFLVAGAVLLSLNYALVRQSLERSPDFTLAIPVPPPPPVRDAFDIVPAPEEKSEKSRQMMGPDDVVLETPDSVESAPEMAVVFERTLPEMGPGVVVSEMHPPTEPVSEIAVLLEQTQSRLLAASLRELVTQSAVALGLMAIAAVGLGWVMAGRVLRPVHDITAVARRLSEQNLHERIALPGPRDELKELADTFDSMLARLEGAFDAQRRFAANASHELRTPLAIIRTEVDVTLADPDTTPRDLHRMAEVVRNATERSERLIDGLLVLARSGQPMQASDDVDLAVAANTAVEYARADAEAAGLSIDAALGSAPVSGDRVLLERLVGNLVENGIRHNCPHGWLHVTTGVVEGRAHLRVANSGPELLPHQMETLFQPFRRLGAERVASQHGAGLGLSIVRSVASAHRGQVSAKPLVDGGLEVTVELPCT